MSSSTVHFFQYLIIFFIVEYHNLLFVNATVDPEIHSKIVEIENGLISGEFREYYTAYEGIPYAEPPIGELRFQPPVPYKRKWEGILQVRTPGASCIQWDHLIFAANRLRGSEDCLFLNVYVPENKTDEILPVVIHIHGGGLMFGNGDFYGPKIIMKRKFVYVNFNYRLGPMGFLNTGDDIVSGNMGLKDQVLVLKWVQKNIAKFGGDPQKVLLTGFSAGGACTHFHYFSKLSKNLFKAGVSHAGLAVNPWMIQTGNGTLTFQTFAEMHQCNLGTTRESIDCLKKVPAENITNLGDILQGEFYQPGTPFSVVIEAESAQDAFLTKHPEELLEEGQVEQIPWVTTVTENEGLYPIAECLRMQNCLDLFRNNWTEMATKYFLGGSDNTQVNLEDTKRAQKLWNEYLQSLNPTRSELFHALVQIVTDRFCYYVYGKAFQLMYDKMPVYLWMYHYKAKYGFGQYLSGLNETNDEFPNGLGVAHGDDVLLMFNPPWRENIAYTAEESIMGQKLLDLYESLINEG